MKGQLPKAYLRIDPNLDQTHPDPGLFVRLLCAGARQPRRGLFRDRAVLTVCLGIRAVEKLLARGDVKEREDGTVVIDGWEIWQEGDMTVGERMRRYRNKDRNAAVTNGVTQPWQNRNGPSEASGVKALGTEQRNERSNVQANPFVPDRAAREALEREALKLTGEIAALTGEDGAAIFAEAAHYDGATRQKYNPANMTDERLLATVQDLRGNLKAAQAKKARQMA